MSAAISTEFKELGALVDGVLELALVERFAGDASRAWVPAYRFRMRANGADAGSIEVRLVYSCADFIRGGTHDGASSSLR